jgi:hypothetical protein
MRIFILKFDDSVEVTESFSEHPYYTHKNYHKGQVFREEVIGMRGSPRGERTVWNVLHRDSKGNGPAWVYTTKVPKEVLFARMLVD